MKFTPQSIPDVVLIEPTVHGDNRGYFAETFRQDLFEEAVGYQVNFIQDNESKSTKGVLRGLHYQLPPYTQAKLVRVIEGSVLDVAVDIRKSSPTFGQHVAVELTAQNKHQLFVPHGFAHGFVVLSDSATFVYKVDNYYASDHDRGIAFDDTDLAIDWQLPLEILQLSEKDKSHPTLANAKDLFEQSIIMRILVTGKNGQLGRAIQKLVNTDTKIDNNQSSYEFIFVGRDELNLSNKSSIDNCFNNNDKFDIIINCAAYTTVDKAEEEQDLANQVNHLAVKRLAQIAKNQQAKLIHISTDYVFDGESDKPYTETDATNPINVYGKTKLAGEKALQEIMSTDAIIIRTSWVYSEFGNNFVKTMLRLGKEREELNVVSDQIGSPTYATDLADVILEIIQNKKFKEAGQATHIYHYSNEGEISWHEFAKEIFKLSSIKCKISPIKTNQYPTPAKRPGNTVVSKNKIVDTFGVNIYEWKKSLGTCLHFILK